MSTTYQPGHVPDDPKELIAFLRAELRAIKSGMEDAMPSNDYVIRHAEPDRIRAGMVVNADGADWNPGSGAGMYRRNGANTAWVHLG